MARVYPFLRNGGNCLTKIGEVKKIEFHLLEATGISQQREKTLDRGMIFDLFCHVLAIVCAVINQGSAYSPTNLQTVVLKKVMGAQYDGCKISGETFASIEFQINNVIEVNSYFGKGIGGTNERLIKIYGSDGLIIVDFSAKEDKCSILDYQGNLKEHREYKPRHVESFLDGLLLEGKPILSIPGVLSFDTALKILEILDEAKTRITDKLPVYQYGDSLSRILEIINNYYSNDS